jgi:metal transporter CNNM
MTDPTLWLNLSISAALVLIGGAFSGLAIALMTQDEVHLQVLAASGGISDQQDASKVLALLRRGKHWILVALLLGNTMTNEALPVVLDEILGGGLIAVVGSTVLIVIFGEIIPQSICARHALRVGAWMVSCVSLFMYIISPIAWPIAKLLDVLVGHDHGTIYKRSELMALFSFHRTLGKPEERLNSDEVMIVHGALGMRERSAACIMTPIEDVFSLSVDAVLDEYTIDRIHVRGFSRIPVHAPDNRRNIVGLLLVTRLVKYNPKSCKRVRDFSLDPARVVHSSTNCLNILQMFRQGIYHMVLVSDSRKNPHRAIGILTREDAVEELIGEEILDEYDDLQKNEQRATRQRNHLPLLNSSSRKIIERAPTYAISAPEKELINLGAVETAIFHKFGSVDLFSAANQWRSIQHVISISEVPAES